MSRIIKTRPTFNSNIQESIPQRLVSYQKQKLRNTYPQAPATSLLVLRPRGSNRICCAMPWICQHPKSSNMHCLRVSPNYAVQVGTNDKQLSHWQHSEQRPMPERKPHTPQTKIPLPLSQLCCIEMDLSARGTCMFVV